MFFELGVSGKLGPAAIVPRQLVRHAFAVRAEVLLACGGARAYAIVVVREKSRSEVYPMIFFAFAGCATLPSLVDASASDAHRWSVYDEWKLEEVEDNYVRRADGIYSTRRWVQACPETKRLAEPVSHLPKALLGFLGFLTGIGSVDLVGDIAYENRVTDFPAVRRTDQGLPNEVSFVLLGIGVTGIIWSLATDQIAQSEPPADEVVSAYNQCLQRRLGLEQDQ